MNNDQVFKEVERRVKAAMKTLPKVVGNEVINFAKDNFRRQGFLGDTFEAWPKRKAAGAWGKTPRNKGRSILIDTGRLRRGNRITQADWSGVVFANDVPYAKAHNEGLRIGVIQNVRAHRRKMASRNGRGVLGGGKINKAGNAQKVRYGRNSSGITFVKAHTRKIQMKMPKRRFIGNSQYLTRNIHRAVALQLNKALK